MKMMRIMFFLLRVMMTAMTVRMMIMHLMKGHPLHQRANIPCAREVVEG